MDFSKTEDWIRSIILKEGYPSFKKYGKGVKVYEVGIRSGENKKIRDELQALNKFLAKAIKTLTKKSPYPIFWFKLNIIDNAVTRLVGIGEIDKTYGLDLITELLINDTADQAGDTIVGLFDVGKEWILKATNDQDNHRVYLKFYGEERLQEQLRTYQFLISHLT